MNNIKLLQKFIFIYKFNKFIYIYNKLILLIII